MSLTAQGLAILGFALAIAIELWWSARRGHPVYSWGDTVDSCVLGAGSVAVGFAAALIAAAAHRGVARVGAEVLPAGPARWLVLLLLVDATYYAAHRVMHRVSVAWAIHAVHHQSQHLNLAVALRIGWLSDLMSWVFYLPLALVGARFEEVIVLRGALALYQFPLHTQCIGRLGWLEAVLVTPSHHRVHHGCDAPYVDRNYGGMLIVWDRLFGTFAAESAPPRYGLGAPPPSLLAANVIEWTRLWQRLRAARWRDRLWLPFRPPTWESRRG